MRLRIARVLPMLVTVPLLAWAVGASSPAYAAGGTRSCGHFKIEGKPVSNVRVTNISCARARRLMVHFHGSNRGLSCFTFPDAIPIHIRCKARVAAPRSGSRTSGRRRFIVAVINFSLPECAVAGECGI